MSAGFTPGPWVDGEGTTTGRLVTAPDAPKVRRNVAACGGPNREANARLIAAAPDLLNALRSARMQLVTLGGELPSDPAGVIYGDAIQAAVLTVIDTAISKATGEVR